MSTARPLPQQALAWGLGLALVFLLAYAVWSLGVTDDRPPPGIFGAAARPGIFEIDSTTTETIPVTSTTRLPATTEVTTAAPTTAGLSSTTPPTSTEPETTTTTLAPIQLQADGLDVVDLGDSYDETVAAVTARLGSPSEDSGWMDATSDFGTCPGTVVRMVRWSSLRLLFSDGPTEFGEGAYHFFYYSQSSVGTEEVLDLATPGGIALDSTVAEITAAFGDDLTIDSTIRFGVSFFVQPYGPGLLSGTLSESSDAGQVTSLGGGFGCGG